MSKSKPTLREEIISDARCVCNYMETLVENYLTTGNQTPQVLSSGTSDIVNLSKMSPEEVLKRIQEDSFDELGMNYEMNLSDLPKIIIGDKDALKRAIDSWNNSVQDTRDKIPDSEDRIRGLQEISGTVFSRLIKDVLQSVLKEKNRGDVDVDGLFQKENLRPRKDYSKETSIPIPKAGFSSRPPSSFRRPFGERLNGPENEARHK